MLLKNPDTHHFYKSVAMEQISEENPLLGQALVSFLLSGGLFVISVGLLIGKYINSDMNFFWTEIGDNLNEKFENNVFAQYLKKEKLQFLCKMPSKKVRNSV